MYVFLRIACVLVGVAALGCQAELQDLCGEGTGRDEVTHPDLCIPCQEDGDCIFMGNPCERSFTCAHRESNLAFTAIGCDAELEAERPSNDGCRCVEALCRVDP